MKSDLRCFFPVYHDLKRKGRIDRGREDWYNDPQSKEKK
jgi:hypothetical protein